MKPDSIVAEVRKARAALLQPYGNDLDALCAALDAKRDPAVRYVSFEPAKTATGARIVSTRSTRTPLRRKHAEA